MLYRAISIALLSVFMLHASGAAMVAQPTMPGAAPLLAQVHFAFAQLPQSLESTYIGALVLGRENLYEATHAAPPVIPRGNANPHLTAAQMRAAFALHHEHVSPLLGIRVPGPPMPLRPQSAQVQAMLRSSAMRSGPQFIPPVPGQSLGQVAAARGGKLSSARRTMAVQTSVVQTSTVGQTGINRWWTYEEGGIPGIGKYMVNVANGNLLVQTGDVDVHERGIDLAIRRTYNGQPGVQRDWNASGTSDDGAPTPGMWGQGWTSNLDTHLALNSSGGISVFDIDGARYDYALPAKSGCVNGPAGLVYMKLCDDGGYGYFLWKKNGSVYHYYSPNVTALPSGATALAGRLYMILAHNQNSWVRLDYAWSVPDATNSQNLRTITVTHADGHTLTLNFAPNPNNASATLLMSVQRPWDSAPTIFYTYDANNDLQTVTMPGNGSSRPGLSPNQTMYQYGYNAPGQLAWAASPRWVSSSGTQGGYVIFSYSAAGAVTAIGHEGIVNFTPDDGTSAVLQPDRSQQNTNQNIATTYFTYSAGQTQLTDTDGHATTWLYDSLWRVTQTQEWPTAGVNFDLASFATWDGNNNVTESVDARGNATDYGYDDQGNTLWVQGPVVNTSLGYGRPVARYSYDQHNNVTAYCDPYYVWTTGATTCAAASGVTYYRWDYSDSVEPFGRLIDAYTPTGYHASISYDSSVQGGDNGLPSAVTGDVFSQLDGSAMQPQQKFTYDPYGNVATYTKGSGNWSLQYDSLNRLTAATDPDGVTSRTCYYDNGQVRATQTAYEYALDGNAACGAHSVSYTYDADRDETTETHHLGQTATNSYPAGETDKWYDGADRLVEVRLPHFTSGATTQNDYYPWAWMTRYIYDLTQNGTLGSEQFTRPYLGAVGLSGHGNLMKTQEYLSGEQRMWAAGSPPLTGTFSGAWSDIKGYSYDALDRALFNLIPVPGTVAKTTLQYDASSATYGLLAAKCDGLNECTDYSYDNAGHQTGVNFVGAQQPTPNRSYSFDPDGRVASVTSAQFGTEKYSYNADGNLTERDEPTGGGVTGASAMKYTLYQNGMRAALSIVGETSSVVNQTNAFAYDYQNDGLLKTLAFNYHGAATSMSYQYTSAGRLLTRTENTPGSPIYTTRYAYDLATGHVTSLAIPAMTQTNIAYDNEDKLQVAVTNTRGEIISQYGQTFSGANGFMIPTTGNVYSSARTDFDAFAATATEGNPVECGENGSPGTDGWSYDTIGRETGTEAFTCTTGGDIAKTYDAENHTVSDVYSNFPVGGGKLTITFTGTAQYQWGPEGHPILMGSGSPMSYDTVHWDGDQVLFATDSAGNLRDFKLGMDADYTPEDVAYKGITFLDRDISGVIVSCHNSTGVGAVVSATAKHSEGECMNASGGMTAHPAYANILMNQNLTAPKAMLGKGAIVWNPGRDGYTDGATTFQGARAYDPQLGNWTTPDAFQGEADDPMSQKLYMWNGNNAIAYADPSGYSFSSMDAENQRWQQHYADEAGDIRMGNEVASATPYLQGTANIATPMQAIAAIDAAAARTMADIQSGITSFSAFWATVTGWTNQQGAENNYNFVATSDNKSMTVKSPELQMMVKGGPSAIAISGRDLIHNTSYAQELFRTTLDRHPYFLETHCVPGQNWTRVVPYMGPEAGGVSSDNGKNG